MLTELRGYQRRAVEAALPHNGFALFPEPRTGKCLISFAIANEKSPDWCIIICPKGAIRVWQEQIKKHLTKFEQVLVKYRILSYGQFVSERKTWFKWARGQRKYLNMLIVDESHYIKAKGSKRSMAVRHFAMYLKYRLILTGTPIAQGLQDAWAQFDCIDAVATGKYEAYVDEKGKNRRREIIQRDLFGRWDDFDYRYLEWGGFKKKKIIGYRNEEEFNRLFHSRSFRITLREARMEEDRPLKIRRVKRYFELDTATRNLYQGMQEQLEVEVNRVKVRVANVLACCMKLQQMTGGCLLPPSGMPLAIGSEKVEALARIVEAELKHKKFVVVCRFLHEIERVKKLLIGACRKTVKVVKGGEPFNGRFDTDSVVLQVQSGIAVDMSAADATVFFSTDYSYLNYEQARFRILDYNKHQATFFYLLARGTIDEDIYESVTRKKRLADVVCDKYRRRREANGRKIGK